MAVDNWANDRGLIVKSLAMGIAVFGLIVGLVLLWLFERNADKDDLINTEKSKKENDET